MRPILLTLLLGLTLQTLPQDTGAASIEGKVLRLGTQEPVAGARVTLTRPIATQTLPQELRAELDNAAYLVTLNPEMDATRISSLLATRERALNLPPGTLRIPEQTAVVTDATGSFSFKNLVPGRYTLGAQRDGYFGVAANGNTETVATAVAMIEEGKPLRNADLFMIQGGVISGRIRDPNGQPVSDIQVALHRIEYRGGREYVFNLPMTKPTDDRGEYRLFWLQPGQYYVGVTPRAPGSVPGPQDSWARTFFPGVTDPSAATLVTVKDGADVAGIDIHIRPADNRTFRISGTAVNPLPFLNPNPITNIVDRSVATFLLVPREPGILDYPVPQRPNARPATQRLNGEFEIRNVPPGNYDLYPLYLDNDRKRYFTSRTPVEVRDADVTGLHVAIDPGVTLSAEVVVNGAGSNPINMESLRVALRARDTTPEFVSIIEPVRLDAAGRATIENVPEGRYSLELLWLPDRAYIEDIRQGGISVYDTGFVLSNEPNPIRIVVNPAGAVVEGSVENADRKPAANVTVVLVPPEPRRKNPALYKDVRTDSSGHFTFRGVPPGRHTLFAWERVPSYAWQNAHFLSMYETSGKPVNVTATNQAQIQLQVIPAEVPR